jgi:hypothetical protein
MVPAESSKTKANSRFPPKIIRYWKTGLKNYKTNAGPKKVCMHFNNTSILEQHVFLKTVFKIDVLLKCALFWNNISFVFAETISKRIRKKIRPARVFFTLSESRTTSQSGSVPRYLD